MDGASSLSAGFLFSMKKLSWLISICNCLYVSCMYNVVMFKILSVLLVASIRSSKQIDLDIFFYAYDDSPCALNCRQLGLTLRNNRRCLAGILKSKMSLLAKSREDPLTSSRPISGYVKNSFMVNLPFTQAPQNLTPSPWGLCSDLLDESMKFYRTTCLLKIGGQLKH